MRLSGERRFDLPRHELWEALHDPALLARALPGCERFDDRGDGTYTGTLTLGLAGARGAYRGKVEEAEVDAPSSYRLLVTAAGAPGTLEASTQVHLDDEGEATLLRYEVDATLGGGVAAMGGQLLEAAADRAVRDFLDAVTEELDRAPEDADGAAPTAGSPGPDGTDATVSHGSEPTGAEVGDTSGDGGLDVRAQLRRWSPTLVGVVVALVAVLLARRAAR